MPASCNSTLLSAGESDKKKGEKTQAVLTAATSRKRDIETMELDTSTSVIKSHKTVHSSHPTLAGEKVIDRPTIDRPELKFDRNRNRN